MTRLSGHGRAARNHDAAGLAVRQARSAWHFPNPTAGAIERRRAAEFVRASRRRAGQAGRTGVPATSRSDRTGATGTEQAKPAEQAAPTVAAADPVSATAAGPGREQAPAIRAGGAATAPACWPSTRAATSRRSGLRTARRPRARNRPRASCAASRPTASIRPTIPRPSFGDADPAKLAADELTHDQLRRHLRAPCQHRPCRLLAGERRGLLRPEGAQRGRCSRQARRRARTCAPRSMPTIRNRRNTRRSRPQLAAARSGKTAEIKKRAGAEGPGEGRQRQVKEAPSTRANADSQAEGRQRRHHRRQHGALALDAARSRRDLRDGQYPRLTR